MAVQVESYQRETPTEPRQGDSTLLTELGFERLSGTSSYAQARSFFPVMTLQEHALWRKFLPRSYSRLAGDWKRFEFMDIPQQAQEIISFAASMESFWDIQVWTPEQPIAIELLDPLVVGVVREDFHRNPQRPDQVTNEDNFFTLVRWGESLISYDDMKLSVLDGLLPNGVKARDLPDPIKEFMLIRLQMGGVYQRVRRLRHTHRSHCKQRQVYRLTMHEARHRVCGVCGKVLATSFPNYYD
jgi:hypothetical protein